MAFFDSLKNKITPTLPKKGLFESDIPIQKNNWRELFSACLGKVCTNQLRCSDLVVKNQNWSVDFQKETITFGSTEYLLQFIGNESNISGTWLWAWNNINQYPDNIIKLANSLHTMGEQWQLEPFTTDSLDLTEEINGYTLSTLACGLSDQHICYYRCTHNSGSAFIAFSGIPNEVFAPVNIQEFTSITMQCIQQFSINHKIFIESFLFQNDTPYEWKNDSIIAHFAQDLQIDFEQLETTSRICNMKTI